MPGQKITLSPRGLFTNVNSLGKIPDGGLLRADNTVISRPGIIESRRGSDPVHFTSGKKALRLFNAKLRVGGTAANGWLGTATPGMVIILAGTGNNCLWTPDGVVFTAIEPITGQQSFPFLPISGDRHFYAFEQNGIIYISTGVDPATGFGGIVAIGRPLPNASPSSEDLAHAGYYMAGVPFGLSATAETIDAAFGEAPGTALESDKQIAYRFTFGYRDSSGTPHLGAPTTRAVAINSVPSGDVGVTKNVLVKTTIPPGIIRSRNFWQLYRTLPSPSADVDPGDDEGLIFEGEVPSDNRITSIERTANVATATTVTPHGYAVGQEFNLTVAVAGSDSPAEDYMLSIAVPSADATRTVWKKTGNSGTWAATAFTFEIESLATSTIADAKKVVLFVSDPVNHYHYYIENYSPYIYVLATNGAYLGKVRLGGLPDLATYDPDTRMVHMLTRPQDSNPATFDYTGSVDSTLIRYVKFSTRNNNVASSSTPSPIPGAIVTPWVSPAPVPVVNPAEMVNKGFMGTWRARPGATLWTVITFAAYGRKPIVVATPDNGASWKEFLNIGPDMHSTGFVDWNVFGSCFYKVTAGDSWKVTDGDYSGETQSAFAIAGIATDPTTPNDAPQHAAPPTETVGAAIAVDRLVNYACAREYTIYQISNDGNDSPGIYLMQTTADSNTIANNGLGYHNLTGYSSLKMTSLGHACAALGTHVLENSTHHWKFAFSIFTNHALAAFPTLAANVGMIEGFSNAVLVSTATGAQTITTVDVGPPLVESEGIVAPTIPQLEYSAWVAVDADNALINSSLLPVSIAIIPGGIAIGTYVITSVTSNQFTFEAIGGNIVATSVAIPITITNISFLDQVAPTFIGPYLYTSTVEEGAINANYPPPVSQDIALFRTYAFYANCTQPASMQVTMLDVAITNGTRIRLAGTAYAVAGDTEDLLTKTFKVFRGHSATTPTASLADDIQNTINSLANVVNSNYAAFKNVIIPISTGAVNFASLFVRSVNTIDKAEFHYVAAGSTTILATNFAPYDIIVAAEPSGNVLYYSKSNIPDAVPLLNSIRIGADSKPIRRIVPARDSLFVFKDDGCFILRGYGPPWQVDPFDLTLQIASQDSLVTLDNAVFGLFTRGVFKVSDANVELLSLPIQDQLERYMAGDSKDTGNDLGFGVSDNPDHKYLLWLPDLDNANENAEVCWVYDTFTEAWTSHLGNYSHIISYKEAKLAYGRLINVGECIATELRTLTRKDLNDGRKFHTANVTTGANVVLTLVNSDAMHMAVSSLAVTAGDIIRVGTWEALVLDSVSAGMPFGVSAEIPTSIVPGTTANILIGIEQTVKFAPNFPTSPAASNHFSEYALSFRRAYWGDFELNIERPVEETDQVDSIGIIPFDGVAHFGVQTAILDRIAERNFLRTYVPRDQQRATLIIPGYVCRVANFPCEVDGIYIVMTPGPTSFTRR